MKKYFILGLLIYLLTYNLRAQSIFSISATPDSICNGAVSYLNATTDGSTIYWFDNILDTVPIGQSASGESFGVYPTTTKAFYSEVATGQAGDSIIFNYTGSVQTFIVPNDVIYLSLDVMGGQGGSNSYGNGGGGGRVQAIYPVIPGQILEIYVGQQPNSGLGGWNGGGNGTQPGSMGGGGASDIRIGGSDLSNRIIVAGGGWGRNGWYGGGGAGAGSNFADSSSMTVNMINEYQAGHGQIIILWSTNRSFIGVNVDPILPVSVYIYSESFNICAGDLVNILTYTTNPGLNPVYQWFVNNENVGENTSMYSYIPSDNDTVKCLLTSSENCVDGTSWSNSIEMKVKDQSGINDIQISCISTDVCVGGYIEIYGGLNMDPELQPCSPFSIRWLKNGIVFDSTSRWGPYINNAALADSGYYSCIISNSLGCDTSNAIHINVHPIPLTGVITAEVQGYTDVLITYNGDTSQGLTFNWNFGTNYQIIDGTHAGPYIVRYSDSYDRRISLIISNSGCSTAPVYSNWFNVTLFERIDFDPLTYIYGRSEWGDFNSDGYLDFISCGDGITKLYRNINGVSFEEIAQQFIGLQKPICKWLDANNDNKLDFIISGDNDGTFVTKLFINTGNGIFSMSDQYFPGVINGSIACFDYNNDGFTDVVITGEMQSGEPITTFYLNTKDLSFNEDTINKNATVQLLRSSIDFEDFNKDGYIDFVINGHDISGYTTGKYTKIYQNNNGLFTEFAAGIANTWAGDVSWGDYNNDGFPDLVISGFRNLPFYNVNIINTDGSTTLFIYKNIEGSGFSNLSTWYNPQFSTTHTYSESRIEWADINNDGLLDLLTTGFSGMNAGFVGVGGSITLDSTMLYDIRSTMVYAYKNMGDNNFYDLSLYIPRLVTCCGYPRNYALPSLNTAFSLSIAPGDYNNDGKTDLLRGGLGAAYNTNYNSSIYKNHLVEYNAPPGIPEDLICAYSENNVNFSWNPTTDDTTPQNALSYNLRIGITSGGNEIMSSLSDSTGKRYMVGSGNILQHTSWWLQGLAPGSYYWSVQAIDNSFAGGPFAPEQTFTVDDYTLKRLSAKVFLEGAFNPGSLSMNNSLLASNLMPSTQPYSAAPWNYNGEETVTSMPEDVIDWVLVELRQAASIELATEATIIEGWPKALLLKADGSIVGVDNKNPLIGEADLTENLYLVIRHRNHLDVMSNAPLTLSGNTYTYDFTDAITKAYGAGAGYKQIATGVFGMVAGDGDADGSIFMSDRTLWRNNLGVNSSYQSTDFDMDGNNYMSDRTLWRSNLGVTNPVNQTVNSPIYKSQVPKDN